jgi:hypothetical protein
MKIDLKLCRKTKKRGNEKGEYREVWMGQCEHPEYVPCESVLRDSVLGPMAIGNERILNMAARLLEL